LLRSIERCSIHSKNSAERVISMHYGSKGWYVEELKKLGVRRHEERKLESYKKHFLANLLEKHSK
jgi:Protein of unknown function (DUF2639)